MISSSSIMDEKWPTAAGTAFYGQVLGSGIAPTGGMDEVSVHSHLAFAPETATRWGWVGTPTAIEV